MPRRFRCSNGPFSWRPASPTVIWLWPRASSEKAGRADARREYQQYLELAPSAPDADTVKSHLDVARAPARP